MDSIQKNENRIVSSFLAFSMHWSIITGLCETVGQYPILSFLNVIPKYSAFFSVFIVCFTFLFQIKKRFIFRPVITLYFWFPAMFLSMIFLPELRAIAPRATIYYLCNVLCTATLFIYISDFDEFFKILRRYLPLSVIYASICFVYARYSLGYSMSFTYSTMIPSLLCLIAAVRGNIRQKFYYIPFLVFLIVNMKIGSRGCILCYLIAIIIDYCFFSKVGKKTEYIFLIISFFAIFAINWNSIFAFLSEKFPDSRNVRLLVNGLALYDAGRSNYYQRIFNEFIKNPIMPHGLYSDRLFMANFQTNRLALNKSDYLWGIYVHNIILEILYQFGVLGFLFIAFLLFQGAKSIKFAKKRNSDSLVLLVEVFFSYFIGQLMISSSYLVAQSFGAFVGLTFMIERYERSNYLIKCVFLNKRKNKNFCTLKRGTL